MFKVAILSFWHVHAEDYARQAETNPETEIVAVWDESLERGRAEAGRRRVDFHADLDELLRRPDVDGVVVIPGELAERTVELSLQKVLAEDTVREELAAGEKLAVVFARHGIL